LGPVGGGGGSWSIDGVSSVIFFFIRVHVIDHPIVLSHVVAAAVYDAPKPFDRGLNRHSGFTVVVVVGSVTIVIV
jgi:hypothetical protein